MDWTRRRGGRSQSRWISTDARPAQGFDLLQRSVPAQRPSLAENVGLRFGIYQIFSYSSGQPHQSLARRADVLLWTVNLQTTTRHLSARALPPRQSKSFSDARWPADSCKHLSVKSSGFRPKRPLLRRRRSNTCILADQSLPTYRRQPGRGPADSRLRGKIHGTHNLGQSSRIRTLPIIFHVFFSKWYVPLQQSADCKSWR
ncbi:hypothetical protein IWX46DRAFT_276850 [Phyllosticta citricarpa]|uniref:Uncharacterized protein n=1 Tax=Phyllosticta citricarpa TaxID=55181 RepID=A0ABR1LLM5_9PEZI